MNTLKLGRFLINNSVQWVQTNGLKSWTGGIEYDGFKYFPRFPDQKDEPYEPTKLLMVQRIKPFRGIPYYHKKILVELKLNGKVSDIAIVKNIPEVAETLYKIKHLIKIQPIRTPNGLPDEENLSAGYLKENGEFLVSKTLRADSERLQLTLDFQTDPARLDAETLVKDSRNKWLNPW
ncbi:39S ribosomal protein L30, mitochondrial [Cimex lectularius]|uniref:Large ribosomal subunit protein uL30m n=1 Tax=Cimex lectularius TaxID=79782 RepID=A0A8I6RU63_CIMLE|nr:39S ribosomal protein L30, mitochondrial [Cimex lectularius]